MLRERKGRFGVNAIISLIEAGLRTVYDLPAERKPRPAVVVPFGHWLVFTNVDSSTFVIPVGLFLFIIQDNKLLS